MISKAKFERKVAELEARLAETPTVMSSISDLQAAAQVLSNLSSLLAAATLTERRALLRQIFAKVWLRRHEVVAITPTEVYMAFVAAAHQRWNEDQGENGNTMGQTGASGGSHGTGKTSGQGSLEAHPAHHQHFKSSHSGKPLYRGLEGGPPTENALQMS